MKPSVISNPGRLAAPLACQAQKTYDSSGASEEYSIMAQTLPDLEDSCRLSPLLPALEGFSEDLFDDDQINLKRLEDFDFGNDLDTPESRLNPLEFPHEDLGGTLTDASPFTNTMVTEPDEYGSTCPVNSVNEAYSWQNSPEPVQNQYSQNIETSFGNIAKIVILSSNSSFLNSRVINLNEEPRVAEIQEADILAALLSQTLPECAPSPSQEVPHSPVSPHVQVYNPAPVSPPVQLQVHNPAPPVSPPVQTVDYTSLTPVIGFSDVYTNLEPAPVIPQQSANVNIEHNYTHPVPTPSPVPTPVADQSMIPETVSVNWNSSNLVPATSITLNQEQFLSLISSGEIDIPEASPLLTPPSPPELKPQICSSTTNSRKRKSNLTEEEIRLRSKESSKMYRINKKQKVKSMEVELQELRQRNSQLQRDCLPLERQVEMMKKLVMNCYKGNM